MLDAEKREIPDEKLSEAEVHLAKLLANAEGRTVQDLDRTAAALLLETRKKDDLGYYQATIENLSALERISKLCQNDSDTAVLDDIATTIFSKNLGIKLVPVTLSEQQIDNDVLSELVKDTVARSLDELLKNDTFCRILFEEGDRLRVLGILQTGMRPMVEHWAKKRLG